MTTNPVKWGGSEELWANVAEEAIRMGYDVTVSVYNHDPVHERIISLTGKGARLHKRPFPSYYRETSFLKRAIAEIKNRFGFYRTMLEWGQVVRWRPEVVLISSGETFDHILNHDHFIVRYCREKRIRCHLISQFNWEHDLDVDESFRASRKSLLESIEGLFFVSYRNYLNARMQLAREIGQARVIHNPVRTWDAGVIPYPTSPIPRIACVARLHLFVKGQDLLLQALAHPDMRDVPYELTFFGGGNDRGHILRLIDFYGLSAKVRLAGHVDAVEDIWREHQLMVLTSRAEGTSLSLLEAMRCGRSALVTNAGDSALWVGNDGYIAESSAVESLVKTLQTAFSDFGNWERQGARCARKVDSLLNPAQAKELVECLTGERPLNRTGFDPATYPSLLQGAGMPAENT